MSAYTRRLETLGGDGGWGGGAKRRARGNTAGAPPAGPRGDPSIPPTNGMCLLDCIPPEMLFEIARTSQGAWYALACAYPTFGRETLEPAVRDAEERRQTVVAETDFGETTHRLNGRLHRRGAPAYDRRDVTAAGEFVARTQRHYHFGKLHRVGGPAEMEMHASGCRRDAYYLDGEMHRTDGPALVETNEKGRATKEFWYRHGRLHREGGPAKTWVEMLADGVTPAIHEEWVRDGVYGCDDGPAYVVRNAKTGRVIHKEATTLNAPAPRVTGMGPADASPHFESRTEIVGDEKLDVRERRYVGGQVKTREYYAPCDRNDRAAGLVPHAPDRPAKVEFSLHGALVREEWWEDGKRHRVGGAAFRSWLPTGEPLREEWHVLGGLHRVNGPAILQWNRAGKLLIEAWYTDGEIHATRGAAVQYWSHNGTKTREEWGLAGKRHRADGPAYSEWSATGDPVKEEWFYNGARHCVGGPAQRQWGRAGLVLEAWFHEGVPHRVRGPARAELTYYYDTPGAAVAREIIEWRENGALHREDGPARTDRGMNIPNRAEWYARGKRHRANGPALTAEAAAGGYNMTEEWFAHGARHREGGPAVTRRVAHDNISEQDWYEAGAFHRTDGPAHNVWYTNERKREEVWYSHGMRSRDDGYAVANWHADGMCAEVAWRRFDVHHRDGAPARYRFGLLGDLELAEWWAGGEKTRPLGDEIGTRAHFVDAEAAWVPIVPAPAWVPPSAEDAAGGDVSQG